MSKQIPGLSDLANRLKDISFPDETKAISQSVYFRSIDGDIHNCYPRTGSHGVEVRFYLGGAARCIGFTDDPTDAARFADMARVRFHKYRKRRTAQAICDLDMNLDLHQVEVDTESVPLAVALLTEIEHLLLQQGIIFPPGIGSPNEPKREPKARKARSTQRGELLATLKSIDDRLGAIETAIKTQPLRFAPSDAWTNVPSPVTPNPNEVATPVTCYPNLKGYH